MSGTVHRKDSSSAPTKCNAKSAATCPYGNSEKYPEAQHYASMEEGQAAYEADMEASAGSRTLGSKREKPVKVQNPEAGLDSDEQRALDSFSEGLKTVLKARADAGMLSFDDKKTPEWATKKFNSAVDYAGSRGNEHLLAKLQDARILSSGSFKTPEGKSYSTDTIIEQKTRLDDIEDKATGLRYEMKSILAEQGSDAVGTKFEKVEYNGGGGKVTMSVTSELNREKFDKLDEQTKAAISTTTRSYSVEKAREVLDAKTVHKLTNRVQSVNYFMGKPKDIDGNTGTPSGIQDGRFDSWQDKLRTRQKEMARLHEDFARNNGMSKKEMTAQHKEATEAAKQQATATQSHSGVFLPARSNKNGALVTNSYIIDKKAADELLTDEQKAAISTTSTAPSMTKAKQVLSAKQFADLYDAPKLNVRVYD